MANHKKRSNIQWNEYNIEDIHANVCTVARSREEISLLFGTEQADPVSQEDVINLTDRIILNPSTAKQLAFVLSGVIKDYESKFGIIREASLKSSESDIKEKSTALFRIVKELGVEVGLEYSFKILEKSLLKNRFLLGINKKEIDIHAPERIIQICRQLNMPQSFMKTFRQCLFDANYVHFGFEDAETTCVYKVYLEFWDSIREDISLSKNFSRPFLLHIGFKWDAFDNDRKSITRYTWYPWISVAEILDRMGAIVNPVQHRLLFETAEGIVRIAAERIPPQDVMYLEVFEDGNPRKSFDINVYRAGLQIGEMYAFLAGLGQYYDVSHKDFHQLYDRVKDKRFGHISGGVNREGKDFFTIYYGVGPLYGDSTRHRVHYKGESVSLPIDYGVFQHVVRSDQVEKTDADAARLLRMVKDLNAPFGFERSIKIMEKTFLPERFLIGVEFKGMSPEQHESVLDICRHIEMPEDYLKQFQEDLPQANVALFGFEKKETEHYYKAYLEYNDRLREVVEENPDAPHPFVIFTGFKWDASDNTHKVITRYTCFPALFLKDMAERVVSLFYGNKKGNPYRIVEGILGLAANRVGPNEFRYFEANEANTERKSYSINLYRANLTLAEIYPLLLEMVEYYDLPKEQFVGIYEMSKKMIVGNLAGGIDREGRDFLTLYYSEKGTTGKRRIA